MKMVFKIKGMTCQGCADTIKKGVNSYSNINNVIVSLDKNELIIDSNQKFSIEHVDSMLVALGNYTVEKGNISTFYKVLNYCKTNKPIFLALFIVFLSSLAIQAPYSSFNLNKWLISYMGMFFILFSFLKLLNVQAFSITFSKYDILAKYVPGFGRGYPFIEFLLGISFLTQSMLLTSNIFTLIFMSSQSIGVINILKNKQIVDCACLGSSINLPISYLTFIENAIMIIMAIYMIFYLW